HTRFSRDWSSDVCSSDLEWIDTDGRVEKRDESSDLGGTMRLGAQECRLVAGSKAREIYGADVIVERHRHRYEVNNNYVDQLQQEIGRASCRERVQIRDHR